MFHSNQPIQEPSLAEQLVQTTVMQLHQLEEVLGYEFAETIDTIERLFELQGYAQMQETGTDSREQEFELQGLNPMQRYEYLSRGEC